MLLRRFLVVFRIAAETGSKSIENKAKHGLCSWFLPSKVLKRKKTKNVHFRIGGKSMNLTEFKREDFEKLPHRRWDEDIGKFNSLVIIPNEYVHDSGFQCMEFVALDKDNNPICKLGGGADVIHLDGIGGYGDRESVAWPRYLIEPKSWSIDCLPCGYLRLFARKSLTCGHDRHDLSSFEVYAE